MRYVVGVDGGNTKTVALVADLSGRVLGAGRSGCGDIYGIKPSERALEEIDRAVRSALAEAGARPDELAAGAFSLAGADWPEDFALLEGEMRERGLGERIAVVNDSIGALRAGAPEGVGVAVACGSGTAIGARAPDGRVWHSSFWQEPHGAGDLANQALRLVYRAELGVDGPTALTGAVLAFFGEREVGAVLHRLTARARPPSPDVRLLARALFDVADAGDGAARALLERHGRALGDYALAAARMVGLTGAEFPLVLAGGVLRHPSPLLRGALVARVLEQAPGARPLQSAMEPAAGALLIALELAGAHADEALRARVAEGLPPHAFFDTAGGPLTV